jgi:hypothetical protein
MLAAPDLSIPFSDGDREKLEMRLKGADLWMTRIFIVAIVAVLLSFFIPAGYLREAYFFAYRLGLYWLMGGPHGSIFYAVLPFTAIFYLVLWRRKRRLGKDLRKGNKVRLNGIAKGIQRARFAYDAGNLVMDVDGMEIVSDIVLVDQYPWFVKGAKVTVDLALHSGILLDVQIRPEHLSGSGY